MQRLNYAIFCVAAILLSVPHQIDAKKHFIPKLPKSHYFQPSGMQEEQEFRSDTEHAFENIPLTPEEQLLLTILEQETLDKNKQESQDEIPIDNNEEKKDS